MLRLIRHRDGPRLYVCGRRLHHGAAGSLVALALVLTGHGRWALAAGAVAAHDGRDFPWRDCDNHRRRP